MGSEDRFGYEWGKYSALEPDYESQFRLWVAPLTQEDFRGKKVLDVGCGMGRNSYWCLKWGAEKVVSFDYDNRSVSSARRNLSVFKEKVDVLFKSIYKTEWKDEFDIVMCIGVLHHLDAPIKAIDNLIRAAKPGGKIIIWVYSYEGNEMVVRFVNPLRIHITSKLPLRLVHGLSYVFSIPIWLLTRMYGRANPYMKQLSNFSFWHIHSIVFDQLIPRIANYWSKEEVMELFRNKNIEELSISRSAHGRGWTIIARK
ncbi:MAG: class I SAM-dependent methyltransferase [Candidatus Portnoybacteria bacterium]|nr:class I SAM-dependent methyltransferase [Candidatus Portnoybacteria bacterium]